MIREFYFNIHRTDWCISKSTVNDFQLRTREYDNSRPDRGSAIGIVSTSSLHMLANYHIKAIQLNI